MGNERIVSRITSAPDALYISEQPDRRSLEARWVNTKDISLKWDVEIEF